MKPQSWPEIEAHPPEAEASGLVTKVTEGLVCMGSV